MANIDLVVNFDHPAATSNTIRYARIDNTVSPSYVTIPGILPGANPYTIPSVPNGQYRVGIKPVYPDGRLCSEVFFDTPACTGINSFSAAYDGAGNIDVTYTADGSLPSVRVNINYPNGGNASQIFTNGDVISMPIPPSLSGSYLVTMQPVCDVSTGFFGVATPPVNVNVSLDQTVLIQNIEPSGGSGNIITNVTGIAGFTFGSPVNEGQTQTGTHLAFTGVISVTVLNPYSLSDPYNGVQLSVNGTPVECVTIIPGSLFGQTINFSSATYAATDVIGIAYDFNICASSPGTGSWSISYTNNVPSVNVYLSISGSNGSGLIYNGLYSTDPLSGTSMLLPAGAGSIAFLMVNSGKTILSATLNGNPGTLSLGTSSWSGVSGNLNLSFVTD